MTDGQIRAQIAAAINRLPQPVLGLVSAVDPTNHAVKVTIQPDGVETGWLPFNTIASGDLRVSAPPHLGQHVQVVPQEGDAEHNVVTGCLFDDVVTAPVSPATGAVAQPGEILIMAGCGAPPQNATSRTVGAVTAGAPYWHLTPAALYFGAGTVQATIKDGSCSVVIGACTLTLTSSGLAVTGGTITTDKDMTAQGTVTGESDVKTSGHSLNEHVHTNGNDGSDTGGPVG